MPKYWPHRSKISNIKPDSHQRVIRWLKQRHGPLVFQHWNYCIQGNDLWIFFIDLSQKVEFDLTWADNTTVNNV